MENLNTSFDQLSALLGQQSIVQASSLLGREVTATAADGQTVAGVVDRVYQQDGELYVEIDGTAVSLSNVSQVTETSKTASDTTESDSSESSEG